MQSKNRRCAHCKKKVPADSVFVSGLRAFCSYDHLMEFAKSDKGKKVVKQAVRKDLQEKKEKLKTPSNWRDEAQAAFNAWVRFRDRDKPCISCGRRPEQRIGGAFDAGHYRSRGSTPNSLRMHSWNVHAQCKHCNRDLSGNVVEYRINLVRRIGIEKVEWLESQNTPVIRSLEYWKRLKQVFQKRLRIEKKIVDRVS